MAEIDTHTVSLPFDSFQYNAAARRQLFSGASRSCVASD
eukprot:CAMPEP_0198507068 /NCGR_PEP_ID=MMETSP1462-20131121/12084_1 /TAXON_ID=1333877 /ORGANISM="Brandtodinium nutriculum, Strain RCC3387" /LENGTH=38 /DNA_ID= /DNA_START= /DNA_END= /DNA_ORIENTATION=